MKKNIFKNMWLKIISVVVAVLIWITLANIYDGEVSVTLNNVSVQLTNINSVTDKGYSYEILNGGKISVNITGPKSKVSNIKANDIVATADLSDLNMFTNSVDIDVSIVKDGEKVSDIIVVPNTSSVIMGIGNKSVKTFPLVLDADSLKETNHVLTNWELPFDTVTISGNADAVDRIATVKATLQGELNEEHATKLSINILIVAYDSDGDVINDSSLTMSRNNISFDANIQKVKTVPLVYNTTGNVAQGYTVQSITPSQKEVTIQGNDDVIDAITNIEIPANLIDITGITSDKTFKVWLTDYLPEGVTLKSDSLITIDVEVEATANN